eukprot:3900998-Pyramimonas_sp.AAC.1
MEDGPDPETRALLSFHAERLRRSVRLENSLSKMLSDGARTRTNPCQSVSERFEKVAAPETSCRDAGSQR